MQVLGKYFVLIVIISFSVCARERNRDRDTQRDREMEIEIDERKSKQACVCVYVDHMYILRHMCTGVYLCVKARDQSRWAIPRSYLSTLGSETGSLTGTRAHQLGEADCSVNSRDPPVSAPPMLGFYIRAGIELKSLWFHVMRFID